MFTIAVCALAPAFGMCAFGDNHVGPYVSSVTFDAKHNIWKTGDVEIPVPKDKALPEVRVIRGRSLQINLVLNANQIVRIMNGDTKVLQFPTGDPDAKKAGALTISDDVVLSAQVLTDKDAADSSAALKDLADKKISFDNADATDLQVTARFGGSVAKIGVDTGILATIGKLRRSVGTTPVLDAGGNPVLRDGKPLNRIVPKDDQPIFFQPLSINVDAVMGQDYGLSRALENALSPVLGHNAQYGFRFSWGTDTTGNPNRFLAGLAAYFGANHESTFYVGAFFQQEDRLNEGFHMGDEITGDLQTHKVWRSHLAFGLSLKIGGS